MTYKEFTRLLGKAGTTAKEFAELLKKNPNSITNNASKGKVPNELGVIAALIGEMEEKGVDYRSVLATIDIQARKVRGNAKLGKFGGSPQETLF
ncbi:XRE family transcriptional regulator [Thalassotalea profundi]|uniref:DNA-binding protein n=1 Tax=Thalassotalea profundi TaxID=2036687 RepID=A0ABQ3IE21_9GAMM|nr:XRE family transcriptional regulator [Thalassotalea profundi]GHE80155.1 hypothetical protein GCM10011501_04980 [Thalassotalea profundi]